jgi:hypothetical protein
MIEIDHSKQRDVSPAYVWGREIAFLQLLAAFFSALQSKMYELEWTMSPSRFYDLLAWAIAWCREHGVWQSHHASWQYAQEQLERRAEALRGTAADNMREMLMDEWRDRRLPGAWKMLHDLDWWMPVMRTTVSVLGREITDADRTETGHGLTPGEAVNLVFEVVDDLSKHAHFRYRNSWGWSKPYPWIDFCRGEMMAWRDELDEEDALPVPDPGDQPFSVGGAK